MPVYEFLCRKCNKTFTQIMSVKELESKKQRCPSCGADDTEQIISHIHTITRKKS